jgi:hypothetical protein
MQPVPTYEDLPVVFSAATQVEIPDPTIDTGYGEGVALPTEHFSWLEYKVTQKIDELATSTLSLLGEMDSYLASRGVTPSGASVTQFQTALAAQIAAASVASAAACTGNSATATQANNALACSGNSATATKLQTARTITISGDATGSTSFDGSGNVTLSLDVTSANTSQECSGNAATATTSAACSGNANTVTRGVYVYHGGQTAPMGYYIMVNASGPGSVIANGSYGGVVPGPQEWILLY